MSNLKKNYRKYIAAAAAICLVMSAAGCSKSDSSSETDTKTASAQISSEAFEISAEDKDIGYDETEAVKIALSGESAEIKGSGAACENGVLSITEGGTYILSGNLSGEIYVKAKGIKAGSELNILGGVISIDSSDDSLHSNGTVNISAGDITASSGDDGTHADGDLTISGGKITVSKSYEGLEGLNIYISGGEIDVTASDDGLNAAGGSDTGSDERAGRDMFADSDENYILGISGGTLKVNASGDGLDSNGNFVMSGGTVIVSGPTNGSNGALDIGDRNSTAQITGGAIVAAGAVGMAVGFSDNSTQYNVLHNFASTAAAGSEFTVTDADGEVLFTCTLDKECQSLVFSSADLASGTYTLTLGDQTEEVELSDICTSNSTSTGMGGRFGGGKRGQESPNEQGGMNDQNGQPPAKPEEQNNQNTANS